MPNEPAESDFKSKVRATAYPTREWGGVVWVFMGPPELASDLPQFEWARVPDDQRCVGKYVVEANYLQVLEGSLDSAHLGFLHTWLNTTPPPGAQPRGARMAAPIDKTPRFFTLNTDFGLTIAARRNVADDENAYYWRLTQMLLPCWAMIPATPGGNISIVGAVPIDDTHVLFVENHLVGERGVHAGADRRRVDRFGLVGLALGRGTKRGAVRSASRTRCCSRGRCCRPPTRATTISSTVTPSVHERSRGFPESASRTSPSRKAWAQICDRPQEHLGTSDLGIIATRRRIIQTAEALEKGEAPYAAEHPDVFHVRSVAQTLRRDQDYETAPEIAAASVAQI